MLELHCQRCGGFTGNPAGTTYRGEASTATPPVPLTSLCVCGEPSLWDRQGGGVHRLRSASRN